jgi:hypothetical protein
MLYWLPAFCCFLLVTVATFPTFSLSFQGSTDDTRGLRPREYAERIQNQIAKRRPHSKGSKKKAVTTYHATTNDPGPVAEGWDVGVTIWRLRPALKTDAKEVQEKTRIAVRKKGQAEEKIVMMTPTRAQSETLFSDGDILKFTIEAPFEAYVYILNREQYADDTLSDPYLIFPATDDVGVNDKGVPGRLLFVPSARPDDTFELKRLSDLNPADSKTAEKTAEVLTVVLSKQPISELPPLDKGNEPRKVDKQLFESWQKAWRGRVWKFENKGGVGVSITRVEKQAGANGGAVLAGDDPTPQTVYHVASLDADVLVFDVSIKIRK